LLSPFYKFGTESYDLGLSPDIYEYQSVVLTNQKRSVPLVVLVFATYTFYETIIHPKGVVVELTVMTAQNTVMGLAAEEKKS
jgi:hypothetical protein